MSIRSSLLDAVTGGRLALRCAGPPASVVVREVGHDGAAAADLWRVLPRHDEALAVCPLTVRQLSGMLALRPEREVRGMTERNSARAGSPLG